MRPLVFTAFVFSGLAFLGCEADSSDLKAKIASSSPSNGQTDVGIDENLTVTFNAEPRPESVSIQAASGACIPDASIWLSSDNFETCTGATVSFIEGTENRKIELVPFPALNPGTLYILKIRGLITFLDALDLEEASVKFTTK